MQLLVFCASIVSFILNAITGCSRVLYMGVVLMAGFFMLSGFSMYYGYSEKICEWHNIKGFYKKRAVSILPTYYIISIV